MKTAETINSIKYYLLLAEDDKSDSHFFKEALDEVLERLPITADLTTVHNGEQLMQLLEGSADRLPHVLFLDLNMPRKNGFECLSEIKQNENFKQLPVIIFSTAFEQREVNRLYETEAHYYIRKPNSFSELKEVIYQALLLATEENMMRPAKENFVIKSDLRKVQR
jgi:CheY-like chemotaxis protein